MKKKNIVLMCAVTTAMCITACGGNRDWDTDSSGAGVSAAQELQVQDSGVIEVPEGAEGALR